MSNVVRAALSRAVKAGTFGKGLGYDSSKTSGGETLDARDDIDQDEIEGLTLQTAADLTYRPLFSTITSDSADIQDDTFTDSGLSVTLPIAGTYDIEALLLYTTPAAQDIQFKFAGTATITSTVGTSDLSVFKTAAAGTTTSAVPALVATSALTAFSVLSDQAHADATPVLVKGKLVATVAGTVKIQFAQVTTGAFNTHVGAGSSLKAQRVA